MIFNYIHVFIYTNFRQFQTKNQNSGRVKSLAIDSIRQIDNKAGALALFGIDLDPASIELDQTFDDSQTKARATAGLGGVEGLEDFREVVFGNAGAVVLDFDLDLLFSFFHQGFDGDPDLFVLFVRLHQGITGIEDQVGKNAVKMGFVSGEDKAVRSGSGYGITDLLVAKVFGIPGFIPFE